jgi:translation elongation factor EF-4
MIQQFDIDEKEILYISAKNGINVESVLHTIIEKIQHPFDNAEELKKENLKAFLFDAKYIPNRGV